MKPAVMRARMRMVYVAPLMVFGAVAIAVTTNLAIDRVARPLVEPASAATCPPQAWPWWMSDGESCGFVGILDMRRRAEPNIDPIGYTEGTTRFRDLEIQDGSSPIATFGVSSGAVYVSGRLFVRGVEVCNATDTRTVHADGHVVCVPARA